MRQCYVIYTCDEWASTSSLRMEYIVYNERDVLRAIRHLAEEGKIVVGDEAEDEDDEVNCKRVLSFLRKFRKELNLSSNKEKKLLSLNDRLTYCYIESCSIGLDLS